MATSTKRKYLQERRAGPSFVREQAGLERRHEGPSRAERKTWKEKRRLYRAKESDRSRTELTPEGFFWGDFGKKEVRIRFVPHAREVKSISTANKGDNRLGEKGLPFSFPGEGSWEGR